MPDRRLPQHEPRNWSEAFAALPLASPERDAWKPLVAEIRPAQTGRLRPLRWSLAAALALAVLLPLAWQRHSETQRTPAVAKTATASATPQTTAQTAPTAAIATDAAVPTPEIASTVAEDAEPILAAPVRENRQRTPAREPGQAAMATSATDDDEHAPLQPLYAQSAQLESVLAQVSDERMASGPAAALGEQLEAHLAAIDASLAQPSLSADARAGLWRARVDALQRLVGFQSTQRWLTAQGERYDGRLLAVY